MRIYITHCRHSEKFDKLIFKLQNNHPEDSYFSPLHNFSYVTSNKTHRNGITELCLDWLNESEKLIVVGKINERMREEIALAKLCNMEVEYLELE